MLPNNGKKIPLTITIETGYELLLKHPDGTTTEVVTIMPFNGRWVAIGPDAQASTPFRSGKSEGEL